MASRTRSTQPRQTRHAARALFAPAWWMADSGVRPSCGVRGLDAYEAAGRKILRDAFDADAVFIETPALLTKLAEDKLDALRTGFLADGWSWVDRIWAKRGARGSPEPACIQSGAIRRQRRRPSPTGSPATSKSWMPA